MAAKKAKKINEANVNAGLYEGEWQVCFDCVGTSKCAHARFYTEPPDPDALMPSARLPIMGAARMPPHGKQLWNSSERGF